MEMAKLGSICIALMPGSTNDLLVFPDRTQGQIALRDSVDAYD
jgi:hypothetical protein